jgi:hypothetical protein
VQWLQDGDFKRPKFTFHHTSYKNMQGWAEAFAYEESAEVAYFTWQPTGMVNSS